MTAPESLGKYRISEVIGRGAMGVVYKAFDPVIERPVAIKTIRKELLEDDRRAGTMLARFKREAKAAGRLSHPGIVAVYEYGEDESVAYIAMEYVQGNTLREYFTHSTRFEQRDAISIITQLLEALAHAHEEGVWHRDIKPANLIILSNGKLKIADFGIARVEAPTLTQTGAMLGTPGYMAPEQYAGAPADWRADIFAAGVVFYQLLVGDKPFSGTLESIGYKTCHADPTPPSQASQGRCPPAYDAVVAKALAKKPDDRYRTAYDFRDAITQAYAQPVSPTVAEETLLRELVEQPAARVDPSTPSRPGGAASGAAPSGTPARRGRAWSIATVAAVLAAGGVAWYLGTRPAPVPPPPPAATATVTPPAPGKPGADQEALFWDSVRNSTDPTELRAYLARFPEGTFAALARARLAALAARETKRLEAPPAPAKAARVETEPPKAGRAEAEAAKRRAQEEERAAAERARLEAEHARARADAEAAAQRASAEVAARARQQAEEEAKRRPEAEAAAAQAAAAALAREQAGVKAEVSRWDGKWHVERRCSASAEGPSSTVSGLVTVRNGDFILQEGQPGEPGHNAVRGRPSGDGRLVLSGPVIPKEGPARGKTLEATFEGQWLGDRFVLLGTFAGQRCRIDIMRPRN